MNEIKILKIYPDEMHISYYNISIRIIGSEYEIKYFDDKKDDWISIASKKLLPVLKKFVKKKEHRTIILDEAMLLKKRGALA